jgi:protoheme IX farnesyltransferase
MSVERSLESPIAARSSLLAAWLDLTKSRIASMVVLSALVGALLAGAPALNLGRGLLAAVCVGMVAASSAIFNHVLERDTDRLMQRTRNRPLITGVVRTRDALIGASILGLAGTLGLALEFNLLSALLGVSTLVAYALVYTPFKRVSSLNTIVGAVPGAMPPLAASCIPRCCCRRTRRSCGATANGFGTMLKPSRSARTRSLPARWNSRFPAR